MVTRDREVTRGRSDTGTYPFVTRPLVKVTVTSVSS